MFRFSVRFLASWDLTEQYNVQPSLEPFCQQSTHPHSSSVVRHLPVICKWGCDMDGCFSDQVAWLIVYQLLHHWLSLCQLFHSSPVAFNCWPYTPHKNVLLIIGPWATLLWFQICIIESFAVCDFHNSFYEFTLSLMLKPHGKSTLVPGNKALPEPALSYINVAIWHH